MDNKLPNLVNLNEDPQLSEMLLYMLKEGEKEGDRGLFVKAGLLIERGYLIWAGYFELVQILTRLYETFCSFDRYAHK